MKKPKTDIEWKIYRDRLEQKKKKLYERYKNRQKAKYESSPNHYLQQVEFSNRSGSHVNCFRYFPNNSEEHECLKFLIFRLLRDAGHLILTEPIFKDRSRCDILDLSTGTIIEILHSEKLEDAKKKAKKYPSCFQVRFISTGKKLDFDEVL
ncbi:hypothetical protein GF312_22245 [Candidatus Poribacteria bacterium]|nr:hypothetical protein [Candidatus Poribacteria bacterium]